MVVWTYYYYSTMLHTVGNRSLSGRRGWPGGSRSDGASQNAGQACRMWWNTHIVQPRVSGLGTGRQWLAAGCWLMASKLSEPSSIDMRADCYASGSSPRTCDSDGTDSPLRRFATLEAGRAVLDLFRRSLWAMADASSKFASSARASEPSR